MDVTAIWKSVKAHYMSHELRSCINSPKSKGPLQSPPTPPLGPYPPPGLEFLLWVQNSIRALSSVHKKGGSPRCWREKRRVQVQKRTEKMPVARPESSDSRVIAHVDMDCFYVQGFRFSFFLCPWVELHSPTMYHHYWPNCEC